MNLGSFKYLAAFAVAFFAQLSPAAAWGNSWDSLVHPVDNFAFERHTLLALPCVNQNLANNVADNINLKNELKQNIYVSTEAGNKKQHKAKEEAKHAHEETVTAYEMKYGAQKQSSGKELSKKQRKAIREKAVTNAQNKKTQASNAKSLESSTRQYFAGVELPPDYKSISIFGSPVATKSQAVALIKQNNPAVRLACSVEELVDIYWEEAEREHVRPDLALAQSIIETGSFRYGGDVSHNQNNFCGLGTTGNGVKGAVFKTPRLGVRAHIQHLLAYTQKNKPSTSIVDPRYDLAHKIRLERGLVSTWYGLNGTWAMGSQYCERIMAVYQKMLAQRGGAVSSPSKGNDFKNTHVKGNKGIKGKG